MSSVDTHCFLSEYGCLHPAALRLLVLTSCTTSVATTAAARTASPVLRRHTVIDFLGLRGYPCLQRTALGGTAAAAVLQNGDTTCHSGQPADAGVVCTGSPTPS